MKLQKFAAARIFLTLGAFGIAATAAIAQTPPDTLMQIDGNASNDNLQCTYGTPCDYWNLLNGNGQGTAPGSGSHSIIRTFINGMASTDSFTGGGSKDPLDLSSWKWSGSPTPNKDTLNAGYAALYAGASGDFALMFGADRASPNGDANIGIWFFQNTVSLNANGTFNGVHKDGDIFVISAFTGGGGNSAIEVLEWAAGCSSGVRNPSPGQCADTHLRLLVMQASSTSCAGAQSCAVTNSISTTSTWEGSLKSPLFFAGGINLTSALGGGSLPCFSSFLEETRSSQSTTAVLKDFVLGGFPVCGMSITKACSTANPPGLINNGTAVQFTWTGTVTNTGVGTLTGLEVDDTPPGSTTVAHPTLFVNSSPVTSLNPGDVATYSVTATVAALTATNNASAKASVAGNEIDATGPNGASFATATCTVSPGSSITVSKSCVAPGPGLVCSGAGCVVQVPIKAHICNTGPVQLTSIGYSDSPGVSFTPSSIPVLQPSGSTDSAGNPTDCVDVTGSYTPTAASGDGATNGRYSFADTISITSATPAFRGVTITPQAMCSGALACSQATCYLCNGGECTQ